MQLGIGTIFGGGGGGKKRAFGAEDEEEEVEETEADVLDSEVEGVEDAEGADGPMDELFNVCVGLGRDCICRCVVWRCLECVAV